MKESESLPGVSVVAYRFLVKDLFEMELWKEF
jgi:hypothetical protein